MDRQPSLKLPGIQPMCGMRGGPASERLWSTHIHRTIGIRFEVVGLLFVPFVIGACGFIQPTRLKPWKKTE
jgi:hypothetical protein